MKCSGKCTLLYWQLVNCIAATAYGLGVYFAVNADYSADDKYSPKDTDGIKHMYACDVLVGEFALGKSGMRTPPSRPGADKHNTYHSVVNDVSNPLLFVIFHDSQAYPKYLISFKEK